MVFASCSGHPVLLVESVWELFFAAGVVTGMRCVKTKIDSRTGAIFQVMYPYVSHHHTHRPPPLRASSIFSFMVPTHFVFSTGGPVRNEPYGPASEALRPPPGVVPGAPEAGLRGKAEGAGARGLDAEALAAKVVGLWSAADGVEGGVSHQEKSSQPEPQPQPLPHHGFGSNCAHRVHRTLMWRGKKINPPFSCLGDVVASQCQAPLVLSSWYFHPVCSIAVGASGDVRS